jgi:hypothetical protein
MFCFSLVSLQQPIKIYIKIQNETCKQCVYLMMNTAGYSTQIVSITAQHKQKLN